MTQIKNFDHVGLTVANLDAATDFFVSLGLDVEGRTTLEGEFLDTVCGIVGAKTEVVMLRPPGGGTGLELAMFHNPPSAPGCTNAMANELGLRNVCFEVDDLSATLAELAAKGFCTVAGVGEHENTWQMAYVRGPEGVVVSLCARVN